MWGSDADDIIRDLFEYFFTYYQEELKIVEANLILKVLS